MAALVIGFIIDLLFANRPDSIWDNVLLVLHLINAGAIIIFLNLRVPKTEGSRALEPILTFLLQLSFGALASNLVVLYGHSGIFTASALFVAILFTMLIGNEFLKSRYEQLRFNVAVYYLLLFTYLVMAVPTFIFHTVDVWVFLASGALSIVIMVPFLILLRLAIRKGRKEKRLLWETRIIIFSIFGIFTAFYFLNIIPPVPLALKGIGVYHTASRAADGNFTATYEKPAWFVFWRDTSSTYSINGSSVAYCFSSVFAPTGLSTPIIHKWQEFNEKLNTWETRSVVSFPISGGRAQGYRGFTYKEITPGKWRCDVETESGLTIGRITFTAKAASSTTQVATATL
jgi:hypothetical protein